MSGFSGQFRLLPTPSARLLPEVGSQILPLSRERQL